MTKLIISESNSLLFERSLYIELLEKKSLCIIMFRLDKLYPAV